MKGSKYTKLTAAVRARYLLVTLILFHPTQVTRPRCSRTTRLTGGWPRAIYTLSCVHWLHVSSEISVMVVVSSCLQNPHAPATSALHQSGAGWVEGQGGGGVAEVPRRQGPPSQPWKP